MLNVAMDKGAKVIVEDCAGVAAGEKVAIITESSKISIAEALARAVSEVKGEPVIMIMCPRKNHGEEPPSVIAEGMKESDVFFCVVNRSITHTQALKNAVEHGSRGLVLTQFSEEMMIQGGIEADFQAIAPVCKSVAKFLEAAGEIHLTTPLGTDLIFQVKGRRGNALYGVVGKGQFSTIPTIEANVSPLENTAEGIIVADASIPYLDIGVLEEPVRCQVKEGFIVSIEGGEQARILAWDLESKKDPMVYNIAEMGIGLNPKCRFMGLMLEDEGVFGSVHIGIGTSITLGGTVQASCHYDLIMTKATIVADGIPLLKEGELCYENLPEACL